MASGLIPWRDSSSNVRIPDHSGRAFPEGRHPAHIYLDVYLAPRSRGAISWRFTILLSCAKFALQVISLEYPRD